MVRNNVVVLLNYMTTKSGYVSNKGHYHSLENWVNNGKVLDYLTRSDKCCVFNDNDLKESYEFNSDAARKEYMRNHIKENVKHNKKSGLYNLMVDKPIDIKNIDVFFFIFFTPHRENPLQRSALRGNSHNDSTVLN